MTYQEREMLSKTIRNQKLGEKKGEKVLTAGLIQEVKVRKRGDTRAGEFFTWREVFCADMQ